MPSASSPSSARAITRLPRSMAMAARECVLRDQPDTGAKELATLAVGARVVVIHERQYNGWAMVGFNGGVAYTEAAALVTAEEV